MLHFESDEIAQKAASIINQQFVRRPSLLQLSHINENVSDEDPTSSAKSDFLKYYLPQLDDSPNPQNEVNFQNSMSQAQILESKSNKSPVSPVSGNERFSIQYDTLAQRAKIDDIFSQVPDGMTWATPIN